MENEIKLLVAILLVVAYLGWRKIRKANSFLLRFGIVFIILISKIRASLQKRPKNPFVQGLSGKKTIDR